MGAIQRGIGSALDENLKFLSKVTYEIVISRESNLADVHGFMIWQGLPSDIPQESFWLETQDGRVRQIKATRPSHVYDKIHGLQSTVYFEPIDIESWLKQEVSG
jgi:hypothetical protein